MSNPTLTYQPVSLPLAHAPFFAWCALRAKEVVPVRLRIDPHQHRRLLSLLLHYQTMIQLMSARDTLVRLANLVMAQHANHASAFLHALGIQSWLQIIHARSLLAPSHLQPNGVLRLAPCETWAVIAILDAVELDFLPQLTPASYSLAQPDDIRAALYQARTITDNWEWLPSFADGFARIAPVPAPDPVEA